MAGSFIAMDAGQERDTKGQWTSSGSASTKAGIKPGHTVQIRHDTGLTSKDGAGKTMTVSHVNPAANLVHGAHGTFAEHHVSRTKGGGIAKDAEQKRDSDGKFGSGGGSSGGAQTSSTRQVPNVSASMRAKVEKETGMNSGQLDKMLADPKFHNAMSTNDIRKAPDQFISRVKFYQNDTSGTAKDEDIDQSTALQGEVGRLARQQARDSMSGRFRR